MRILLSIFSLILIVSSCNNKIETADTLQKQDFDRLYSLKLLDSNEQLYKFYSEFNNSVAGNFISDKRLATYWLDKMDSTLTKIEYAYYKDIKKMDPVYYAGATYCPYLQVTRSDGSTFKVCADGKKHEITDFFNVAIKTWRSKNKH